MICFGLHQGYDQFGMSMFTMHDQWTPPLPPIKFVPGLVEGPAFMGYHPNRGITHKVGKKTHFDGAPAVQQGHDVGYLIPHLALPVNLMMVINTVLSKHKVIMPKRDVLIEHKMMGTYLLVFMSMVCCNPVGLPTGLLVNLNSTVVSKMSLKDVMLGLVFITFDMLIDAVWSLALKGDAWAGPAKQRATAAAGAKLGPSLLPKLDRPYKKMLDNIYKAETFSGPAALHLVAHFASKGRDHVWKSWIAGPLAGGAAFQLAQPLLGHRADALPSLAIGRGELSVRLFPFPLKVGGNVLNI